MSYKPKNQRDETFATPAGFAGRLRELLERKIRDGRDGMDLNEHKKGASPFIVHRNFEMPDDVFDLGVAINSANPNLTPALWLHWMTDAEVRVGTDKVTIRHRTAFFCDGARRHLGGILAEYFNLPIAFIPDHRLEARVTQ